MRLAAFLLLVLAWPAAAAADMRATWRSLAGGARWTSEVAANGDARFQQEGQGFYMLRSGGRTHVVYTGIPGAPHVVRVADLQQVMSERGVDYRPAPGLLAGQLVRRGEAEVAGRSGEAWYLQVEGRLSGRPAMIVSRDPAIAPLGALLAEQIDFSMATMRMGGGDPPANLILMRRLIDGGVPLLVAGYALETLETAPVPAGRFRLPAPPATMEDLRRRGGLPPPSDQ